MQTWRPSNLIPGTRSFREDFGPKPHRGTPADC